MQTHQHHDSRIAELLRRLGDSDGQNRLHARKKLVAEGRRVTARLLPLLAANNQRLRWEAAKALADIADPDSVSALISALEDPDQDVRWLAAEALAHIGRPAIVPLLMLLEGRPDNLDVREGVHHVLHELRDHPAWDLVAPVYRELSDNSDNLDLFVAAERAIKSLT